ncbi:MAG: di-heme enzyme [endosymbiont of Galathealinum brachiosum]|uniref:Di-heme enzyme n=1 Tax=endosymbiont of Galathealinum brachiosum TaxID=2200906 RepID=A0A370DM01_9GAMM|nr:MAG: di-heme enzyme [endosymbiont of Galathealinum brachiosum]
MKQLLNTIPATILSIFFSALLTGCGGGGEAGSDNEPLSKTECGVDGLVSYPADFPEPSIPCDFRLSNAKIELGRFLFYDRNMSFNQTQSCADCHQQDKAFTDGLVTSIGSEGAVHPRNSMSMGNVVYNATQNWSNNVIVHLHEQALAVLTNEDPVELGWEGNDIEIANRFRQVLVDPVAGTIDYPTLFNNAFPDAADPFTIFKFTEAIGAFGATMITGNSAFDKTQRGDANAMSDSAKRGREIFFSERTECFHCHGGFNFSDSIDHTGTALDSKPFHNTGLYNLNGDGSFPDNNPGLIEFTLAAEDEGKFRAPTLRNIELTAPYMHDGSIASLEEVIAHYKRGGRLISTGENQGDGALNPNKSSFISGFILTAAEEVDLIEFLKSLTDMDFVCNPELSDPFENIPMHTACP